MSITHTYTLGYARSGESISQTVAVSNDSELNADVALTASEANKRVAMAIDVSQMKGLFISSDVDVTIETNNSGTPVDTLSISADEPLIWFATSPLTNPLGTDVTTIYVTNGEATAGTCKIRVLIDGTP